MASKIIDYSNYAKRQTFFDHPTERIFYELLRDEILGENFIAIPQIPIPSLIEITINRKKEFGKYQSYWGRIQARRIDFLLCTRHDVTPLLGIELDGSSHNDPKRIERDIFVNTLFASVGLPLLRMPLSTYKNKEYVTNEIARKLGMVKKPTISN